jgi:hypothetical protein
VCLGGHPNTRFSGHGEVKFAPFLLREGGLRGCQKSEIGRESVPKGGEEGRTATTPSTMHTLFRHGVGRMAVKFPTFRSPSSRGLFGFPAQGRETSNKGGKPSNNISAKPLPSEIQGFSQSPPPPITRQHTEGGREHFSVSPLPTPAVGRDRPVLYGWW